MSTVAEGVETTDHLHRVVAAGCNAAQGYLLSRPVPRDGLAGAIASASAQRFGDEVRVIAA
jgi:EAL domain-containing protein (putative c-di-GMP-specific phosphodiesterase class I)